MSRHDPSQSSQTQASTAREYTVSRADLPLSCPSPAMQLWNSHPRVYLAIESEGGQSVCPYCGASYRLID